MSCLQNAQAGGGILNWGGENYLGCVNKAKKKKKKPGDLGANEEPSASVPLWLNLVRNDSFARRLQSKAFREIWERSFFYILLS